MTDRELLGAAAKASGIKTEFYENDYGEIESEWNPLTDDGDALRLAVKLKMTIDRSEVEPAAFVYCDWRDIYVEVLAKHGDDPYAATRRAIVRAAAEIGTYK